MHGRARNLAPLAVLCWLALATGCAETASNIGGFVSKPFKPKSTVDLLHVKSPEDRVKELRELAKSGPGKSAEEQERVSRELAAEIRQENDPIMRRQLLRTLASYPTPLALAVLVGGTSDSDSEVRRVACTSLGSRGGLDAVRELTRVANSDNDPDVRLAAVRALGDTHEATAMPALAEALVDSNPAMQYRAKESLRAVSGRDYGDDVEAWREYAKTGKTNASEVSIADRMWRYFTY